jgi:hypothetical protein
MPDLYRAEVHVPKVAYDYINLIGPVAAGNIIIEYMMEEVRKLDDDTRSYVEEDTNLAFTVYHDVILEALGADIVSMHKLDERVVSLKRSKKVVAGLSDIAGNFAVQVIKTMIDSSELVNNPIGTKSQISLASPEDVKIDTPSEDASDELIEETNEKNLSDLGGVEE